MMMVKNRMLVLLFGIWFLFQGGDSDVRCRDDNGNEVDWYIIYKFPGGLKYLYMDEQTDGWETSDKTINSDSAALGNTLKPLLDFYNQRTEGFGYLLYNDQPPDKDAPKSFGHSKGVVMLDEQTGVWLSHSTPRFPVYRNQDFWPKSGTRNAQTFICVTFSYDEFKEIGLQLKYIHVFPFDHDMPPTFHPELQCVSVTKPSCYPKKQPWFRVTNLTSINGREFRSFAKYKRFGDDLYSGLIVQHLEQNLFVKSGGESSLPSNCSTSIPHHVYNVKKVKQMGPVTEDHSKWCVAAEGGWTCIADTNREESQMERGGGAICTEEDKVATAFRSIIDQSEPCVGISGGSSSQETNSNVDQTIEAPGPKALIHSGGESIGPMKEESKVTGKVKRPLNSNHSYKVVGKSGAERIGPKKKKSKVPGKGKRRKTTRHSSKGVGKSGAKSIGPKKKKSKVPAKGKRRSTSRRFSKGVGKSGGKSIRPKKKKSKVPGKGKRRKTSHRSSKGVGKSGAKRIGPKKKKSKVPGKGKRRSTSRRSYKGVGKSGSKSIRPKKKKGKVPAKGKRRKTSRRSSKGVGKSGGKSIRPKKKKGKVPGKGKRHKTSRRSYKG